MLTHSIWLAVIASPTANWLSEDLAFIRGSRSRENLPNKPSHLGNAIEIWARPFQRMGGTMDLHHFTSVDQHRGHHCRLSFVLVIPPLYES